VLNKRYHILIVNYAYEQALENPHALLRQYFMLPSWAKACSFEDTKVTVFQRFKEDHILSIDGVEYMFVSDNLPPALKYRQCAFKFNREVKKYVNNLVANNNNLDICLHINGFIFPLSTWHLTKISCDKLRFIIQHHAESPHGLLFNLLSRWANKSISRFFFTTRHHAQPWVNAKILSSDKVVELMECSSNCLPQDKIVARKKLGIDESPVLLWTGNLDDNKDPLTILVGFKNFLQKNPNAKLLMLFRHSKLLPQVNAMIAKSKQLKAAVDLVGKVNYQHISDYYNAADIFVQGSEREGSGIAVLDALACGAIPVITSIASFETLTQNAKVGRLWQRGKVDQFVDALHSVMSSNLAQQQQDCIHLFNQQWTFDKLARQARAHYFGRQI